MNIKDVINEELDGFISEILTTGTGIKTYDYTEESEGRFHVHIAEPATANRAAIDSTFLVSFGSTGKEEERAYSIAFKPLHGNYSDKTGFGVQFRLLATISKIVKELIPRYNPNILTFQPVKEEGERGNRRLNLYMQYVKGGAGEDFDAFVIGDNYIVNVEKRHPSFPLKGDYVDQETIQDIVTQLSLYGGYYVTDLSQDDPDYAKFTISSYGEGRITRSGRGSNEGVSTHSMRKLVDEIFTTEFVKYVHGSREPKPVMRPTTPQAGGEVPIQRVSRSQTQGTAMAGSFGHFLQTQIYGNPEFEILDPYFETMKSFSDFQQLKERANLAQHNARTAADRERLQGIADAVDSMKELYGQYTNSYGRGSNPINETLDELIKLLE